MLNRLFGKKKAVKRSRGYNLRTHKYFVSYVYSSLEVVRYKNIEMRFCGAITNMMDIKGIERNLSARHGGIKVTVVNFELLEVQNG